MRILNWMQNKFNGAQEKKRSDIGSSSSGRVPIPDVGKEELNNLPHPLLSIGTFGNKNLKEEPQRHESSEDLPDFTLEEVRKLQEELTKLLRRKSKSSSHKSETGGGEEKASLPLDRFLNCPSSLEVDRTAGPKCSGDVDTDDNGGEFSPNTKIILCKARDLIASNRSAIKQKSLKFLLKKMFVCSGGFAPSPSLKDPTESRMEKIMRTLLHKKFFHQSSSSTSTKKYLENKPIERAQEDEKDDKGDGSYRWVKTDSEYIVLEI
ncbi:protein NEGATIVE GRAVITROPIC RESPONSE OF ROOTS-like [Typha latifolia]|uniref:protein NEGATIVE GRAVITROPIC RESPONSE OF ROOTS-like n=1 Tax=Typha latifolia TaxID=4733 RepID=UPI003C2DB234